MADMDKILETFLYSLGVRIEETGEKVVAATTTKSKKKRRLNVDFPRDLYDELLKIFGGKGMSLSDATRKALVIFAFAVRAGDEVYIEARGKKWKIGW